MLALAVIASAGPGARASAQRDDIAWAVPVNVSRSGAASTPIVVSGVDDTLRVFWWDSLDGLTIAEGVGEEWSEPVMTPIYEVEVLERPLADGSEALYTPVRAMPRIIGDPAGNAHAFWLREAEEGSRGTALMYAKLSAGRTTWSNARVVAESASSFVVTTDAAGWLYLAYSRNLHATDNPSGIAFQLSSSAGDRWGQAVAIHSSLYYRSATPQQLALRIAANSEGLLVLTWNDPHLATALLAESLDSGDSWSEPISVDGSGDSKASNARSFIVYGESASSAMVLWEGTDSLGGCALYQSPLEGVVVGAGGVAQRVLEGLNGCPSPETERLVALDAEQVFMLTGGGSDTLTLSLWNGEAWSEPKRLSVRFEDVVTGRSVYLGGLWATLVSAESQGDTHADLAVVGVDTDGDVWVTQSQVSALSIAFAPPSPWALPVAVLQDSAGPDVPVVTIDGEGTVHAVWSEPASSGATTKVLRYARHSDTGWTRAATVLQSSAGSAAEPSIVVAGDRLHAVWSEGPEGQIRYSRAFLQDAYSAGGWDEARSLPGPASDMGVGSRPQIIVSELDGSLHAAYAVPVNEGRGIYYVTSADAGVTWSDAMQVFDAEGAAWASVNYPRLEIDPRGTVHAVWIRATLSADVPSQGVYYAYSSDGGQTWSVPLLVAEGAFVWPDVVADGMGGVHLFWSQASAPRSWWHQWSPSTIDGLGGGREASAGWVRAARLPGFSDVEGPLAIVSDDALGLHVLGLGLDSVGEPALLRQSWSSAVEPSAAEDASAADDATEGGTVVQTDGKWEGVETYRLDPASAEGGVAAALESSSGRLDVLFRAVESDVDGPQWGLWHTTRLVDVTTLDPEYRPGVEPVIAPTPVAETAQPGTATPEATSAQDEPTLEPVPAPGGESSMVLLLLVSAGLAAVVVLGVLGSRLLVKRRN